MTNERTALLNALSSAIAATPEKERQVLAQALEDYAYKFSRSYRDMTRGSTMIASLLDCIEENSDARIERDRMGTPSKEF